MFLRLSFRHRSAPLLRKLVSRASHTVKTPQTEQFKVSFTAEEVTAKAEAVPWRESGCALFCRISVKSRTCKVCDDD